MKNQHENELKKELIEYIIQHEPSFKTTDLQGYTVAQLNIVKMGIDELKAQGKRQSKK